MGNRLEAQQLGLSAERTSPATLRANQRRLHGSSSAHVLMQALRRPGLAGTAFAKAQSTSIQAKLPNIGARIRSRRASSGGHSPAPVPAPRISPRA